MAKFRVPYALVSVIALLLVLTGAACGDGETAPRPTPAALAQFPYTLTRSDGKALTIAQPPQRIVSLSVGATESLFAIGAGSQVAAVEQNSDFPPEAARLPKVSGFTPSVEAIVGLRPDLVFVFFDADGIVGRLDSLGIPVLYLKSPNSVAEVLEEIRILGRVTGRRAEAETLVQQMQRRIDAIGQKLQDVSQGPRVYHELDPGLFTAAPNSFVGDLYRILRAQNIAAGASQPYPQLSAEVVLQRNPQVIILADEVAGESAATVQGRPGWSGIEAVQKGRIYIVNPSLVSRPGPRIVDGLETLARLLYPERFP